MTLSKYLIIQEIVMAAIMVLGLHLTFERMPKELKGSDIQTSCRIIGIAITIIPITSFIYYFSGLRHANELFTTAINLSAYCITSVLIALAYYTLIGKVMSKHVAKIHIGIGVLYPMPLWFGVCLASDTVARQFVTASYTVFFTLVVLHTASCCYYFTKEREANKENSSKERQTELKLLRRILHISMLLAFVSICSPSFFSYPLWLGLIFVTSFAVGVVCIYVFYQKMLTNRIRSLIASTDDDTEDNIYNIDAKAISDETTLLIEKNLELWLHKKGYLNHDVTVNTLAKITCTNRTYLSRYINTKYQCSFRTWLTNLRIEEAKQLMLKHPELHIAKITKQIGFASIESFSHIFTREEGVPPSKWRELQGVMQQEDAQ